MATPVVSGAVALMLQKNPGLSPDTVKARLMKTASKSFPPYSTATDPSTGATYVSTYDIFTVGAGYLDINAALANKDVAQGSAQSPSVMYDPATQQAYMTLSSQRDLGQRRRQSGQRDMGKWRSMGDQRHLG